MLFLFLIYIKTNHIVSSVKQLAADNILLFIAICYNFSWQIKPRFKSKSECVSILVSCSPDLNYIIIENDKISLTNLFQHLLSAEILSE